MSLPLDLRKLGEHLVRDGLGPTLVAPFNGPISVEEKKGIHQVSFGDTLAGQFTE